jgi:hypothetical protein
MLRTSKLLEKGFGLLVLRSSTTTIPRHHNRNKHTLSEADVIHLHKDPKHAVGTPFDPHHPLTIDPETGLVEFKADSSKKSKKKKKKREEEEEDGIDLTTTTTIKLQLPPLSSLSSTSKDNTYNSIKEAARKTGDPVTEWMAGYDKKGSGVYESAKGSKDEMLEARKRYAVKGEGNNNKQHKEEDNKEKINTTTATVAATATSDAMESGEKIIQR